MPDPTPRTAREAFAALASDCQREADVLAAIEETADLEQRGPGEAEGHGAKWRKIGASLDLIAGLPLPEGSYSAGHVLAGFLATETEICARLADMLRRRGVVPVDNDAHRGLWAMIGRRAEEAAERARRRRDHRLAARYGRIAETYLHSRPAFAAAAR